MPLLLHNGTTSFGKIETDCTTGKKSSLLEKKSVKHSIRQGKLFKN
jgi:hypothetical protein